MNKFSIQSQLGQRCAQVMGQARSRNECHLCASRFSPSLVSEIRTVLGLQRKPSSQGTFRKSLKILELVLPDLYHTLMQGFRPKNTLSEEKVVYKQFHISREMLTNQWHHLLEILYKNVVGPMAVVRSWHKQNAIIWDVPHLPKHHLKLKGTQNFEIWKLRWNFFINSYDFIFILSSSMLERTLKLAR